MNRYDTFSRAAVWLLLLAAAAIPATLVWDFSWESTVGIDLVWAPAHLGTYLAVALAGLLAVGMVFANTLDPVGRSTGVELGPWRAPLGAWAIAWGALAFAGAMLFDRWWRGAYGLAAGIWHPPQILKAVAFFAVLLGVWLACLSPQNRFPRAGAFALTFSGAAGLVLALITVVTLVSIYPNRQHAAWFYKVACATYPVVLVAVAKAGKLPFAATFASLAYMAVLCLMVWLLPLYPARPQVAPIYNALDHMMPPPFPLLLILPAVALDALFGNWPARLRGRSPIPKLSRQEPSLKVFNSKFAIFNSLRLQSWFQAGTAGLAFFIIFLGAQWAFSEFLLTGLADNWFFAGGGEHWPFFLKIDPQARQIFWQAKDDPMNFTNTVVSTALAVLAARIGLWLGASMQRLRR